MSALARRDCLGLALAWLASGKALAQTAPSELPILQAAQLEHAQTFELNSRHTGQRYRIWLGLPDGPLAPGQSGYPALLALDGQAVFALMEPQRARPQLRSEFRRSKMGGRRPGLVVGIGYASGDPIDVDARALDYTPTDACAPCDKLSPRHGGAAHFLDFIELELLPTLARLLPHLPVDRRQLSLFGHSYGGQFTLYTLLHRPALFARYWASSPSLWFGNRFLLQGLAERLAARPNPPGERRVHIAVGLLEQAADPSRTAERNARLAANRMVDNARDFVAALRASDWPGLRLSHAELAGHDHGAMLMQGAAAVLDFAFGD
ncbi:hypothetical protein DBR47_04160 [Paucibacter sp. KBW04]|uniref:alpha/beta hydrolase n=1 Tax=Paucibacter sp. KBW04 TaxID=2153361 RepID=UPI000F562AC0|nr:alpha/beta hydrolase-fold protein [Paucibacter sp. KBW04]RQO62437.1 hypothetical protein DBR47_04160 [Paucibacter sp. KBW04]